MKRTTAPQQGEVTSLTTLLREGMSRTMKQPGLVPGESNWPETDTGIRIGEGSPRVVETTGTGRVGGSEEGKFMVSPGLDVGVHSQGEDRDRGLTISDPSGNTESRVQAASERKGGPDDHRERDPGGIVASPLARGPDSLPCASVTGDAGRGVEEFQVQSGADVDVETCHPKTDNNCAPTGRSVQGSDVSPRAFECATLTPYPSTFHNGESTKSTRHLSFSFEPDVTLLAKRVLMLKIVQKIIFGLSVF